MSRPGKSKGLIPWMARASKEMKDETTKAKDDPVRHRQVLASKVCELRSNMQALQNLHQKYLFEIMEINGRESRRSLQQQRETYNFIVKEKVGEVRGSFFELAKCRASFKTVESGQERVEAVQVSGEEKGETRKLDEEAQREAHSCNSGRVEEIINQCTDQNKQEIQDNVKEEARSCEYGVKKELLNEVLLQQIESYQSTGQLPVRFLSNYNRKFPLLLTTLEQHSTIDPHS